MKVQLQYLTISGITPGLFYNDNNKVGSKQHKKAPDKDEGNLMFSQRNNPYCELLQISESKDI